MKAVEIWTENSQHAKYARRSVKATDPKLKTPPGSWTSTEARWIESCMRRRFWRTCVIRMILTGGTALSGSPFRMTAYMSFQEITPRFLFFWGWQRTNGWTSWWRAAKESGVILTIRAACCTPFEIAGNKSINISGTIRSGDRDPANSSKSLWSAWSEKAAYGQITS